MGEENADADNSGCRAFEFCHRPCQLDVASVALRPDGVAGADEVTRPALVAGAHASPVGDECFISRWAQEVAESLERPHQRRRRRHVSPTRKPSRDTREPGESPQRLPAFARRPSQTVQQHKSHNRNDSYDEDLRPKSHLVQFDWSDTSSTRTDDDSAVVSPITFGANPRLFGHPGKHPIPITFLDDLYDAPLQDTPDFADKQQILTVNASAAKKNLLSATHTLPIPIPSRQRGHGLNSFRIFEQVQRQASPLRDSVQSPPPTPCY